MTPEVLEAAYRRALKKIEVDAETGCHIWKGGYARKRRGARPKMYIPDGRRHGRTVSVARVMCEHKWGPPPTENSEAAHRCPLGENQKCVNEDHLEWAHRIRNEAMKRRR
jgi:hypothetical protein